MSTYHQLSLPLETERYFFSILAAKLILEDPARMECREGHLSSWSGGTNVPRLPRLAFNEVNEARQDRERTINQAQEQANREVPKARGEATRIITEAEGYAPERANRANGEAARFRAVLEEYQRVPEDAAALVPSPWSRERGGEPVTEAGLHVKLPFVQDVRRFEKRLLIWGGDPNQIPTKGREFIWVDTTAR